MWYIYSNLLQYNDCYNMVAAIYNIFNVLQYMSFWTIYIVTKNEYLIPKEYRGIFNFVRKIKTLKDNDILKTRS